MTETIAASGDAEAPEFPMARECPYHPPAGYEKVRARGPLSKVTLFDGRTVWLVSTHAEARALLSDARVSSDWLDPRFPVASPRRGALQKQNILIGMDPPEHGVYRRMLIPRFTVKRVKALRPAMRRIVDSLLDNLLEQGPPADLVPALAVPVPSSVICELLGVPYADHDYFERQTSRLVARSVTAEEAVDALGNIRQYLDDLIKIKETAPGDGLLDELLAEQVSTGRLPREELVTTSMMLLMAGHETTANMISLGTLTLLQHPGQLAKLVADGSLVAKVVEELMRFLSIADAVPRLALEDVEIGGQVIRAGDGIFLSNALINRDPAVFGDPDELDITRSARQHTAFGYGLHQCLGQNLARAELEVALGALFERIPALRLAVPAEELPAKGAFGVQGVYELPVTW